MKDAEVEESAEGTEAGPEVKKRKTGKSQKLLVAPEEKEVDGGVSKYAVFDSRRPEVAILQRSSVNFCYLSPHR